MGNFRERKISQNGKKQDFHRENFRRLLTRTMPKDSTPPNFVEKIFTNNYQTAKFAKVFSLETFPLYGTLTPQASLSTRLGQVVKECGGWTLVCIEYRVHRVQSTQCTEYRVQSTQSAEYTVQSTQSTESEYTELRVHRVEST